jgi:O-antigen ligase
MAPIFLFVLFKIKNPTIKIAAPLFVLIYTENIIISRLPITDYFKISITLIFGITALVSILWHQKRVKFPKYIISALFLFLVSSIIGILIGSAKGIVYRDLNIEVFLTYFMGFAVFLFLGYQTFENPNDIYKIVMMILFFAFLTAVGQLFSIMTGKNLELLRGSEMVASGRDLAEGQWRYGGFFGNVNSLSAFFVMTIPGCLLFLFSEKESWIKLLAGISIMLMLAATIFGASRGALLFVATNLIISLFFFKVNAKQILFGATFIIVLLIVVDSVFNEYIQEFVERAIEEMTKKGTDSPREVIWQHTFTMVKDYPLGVGLADYNYMEKLATYANLHWANPHNMYLHFLVQNGYLGFIAIMFIIIYSLVTNIKAFKRSNDENYKLSLAFLLLMITGFMLMGLTEPLFRNQFKLNYIIAVVLGLSMSLSHKILVSKNNDFLIKENKPPTVNSQIH